MTTDKPFDSLKIGDSIPSLIVPPVDRTTLALFAGASGDHNPIHIDQDFARRAGMPDVFAHGMLGMAWLSRLLIDWRPQSCLRTWTVRFAGIIHLGNAITCRGVIAGTSVVDGEPWVLLDISAVNQFGETKIAGQASVAFPSDDFDKEKHDEA